MTDEEFAIEYIKTHDTGDVSLIDIMDDLDELLRDERNILSRVERNKVLIAALGVAAPDAVVVD